MTVAVLTTVYGDYVRYLPHWLMAVAEMRPVPDQAVLVTDHFDPLIMPSWLDIAVVEPTTRNPRVDMLNTAVGMCEADWCWRMDVDDAFLPDALEGLDELDADVWNVGYVNQHGYVHQYAGTTAEGVLASSVNVVNSCSPFRKEVWRRSPFVDVAIEDWALWRGFARLGARFANGPVAYRYDWHPSSSASGAVTAADIDEALAR